MLQRFHVPRGFSVLFWIFLFVIGVVTGLIAFATGFSVSLCLYTLTKEVSSIVVSDENLQIGRLFLFVVLNLIAVLLSATLVLYVSPVAAGSGIPNMYAYLNGVEMPEFLNIRVALAKVPGSILAVAGGLCIGKEGPMLHVGSIVATWLGNTKLFKSLRGSREQDPLTNERYALELVACGVAGGLAAGFSAPVGGLLFALEMSTRWRSELTARTLFACAVVALVTQACKDVQGKSTMFNYGSLLFFRDSLDFPEPYAQIPLMAILGVLGGFVGCMYVTMNIRLGMKRRSYLKNAKWRYLELAAIGLLTTGLRLVLPLLGDCRKCMDCDEDASGADDDCHCAPGAPDLQDFSLYGCDKTEFNDLGVLMFNPQGYVVKALFATPSSGFSGFSLLWLFLFNYSLSILTYGAAVPAGLFTPSLITGGALGQLFAFVVNRIFDLCNLSWRLHGGFYALLGAASVLGGLFRFSVSFSVILAELTGAEDQLPFLMLVLIIAKGVGDRFNQSMLNHLCILLRLPYIGGHPESTIRRQQLTAEDVMDDEYPKLCQEEDISVLKRYLQDTRYAAFPVLEVPKDGDESTANYVGMITADGIANAIRDDEAQNHGSGSASRRIILTNYICRPLVIPPDMSLISVHRLFTTTGLQYLPVMESYGPVSGVITRHQLHKQQNKNLHRDIQPFRLSFRNSRINRQSFVSEETTTLLVKDAPS